MKHLLLLLFISTSFSINAAETDAELDVFFTHYLDSYATYFSQDPTRKNIQSITQHFFPQTLRVPPTSAPTVVKNRNELAAGFRFFVDSLQDKGAVRLRWQSVQYVKLGDKHALASNIAHVLDKNDHVIDVRSSVYSLYKTELGWQIFMIQPIKPAQTPFIEPRSAAFD